MREDLCREINRRSRRHVGSRREFKTVKKAMNPYDGNLYTLVFPNAKSDYALLQDSCFRSIGKGIAIRLRCNLDFWVLPTLLRRHCGKATTLTRKLCLILQLFPVFHRLQRQHPVYHDRIAKLEAKALLPVYNCPNALNPKESLGTTQGGDGATQIWSSGVQNTNMKGNFITSKKDIGMWNH